MNKGFSFVTKFLIFCPGPLEGIRGCFKIRMRKVQRLRKKGRVSKAQYVLCTQLLKAFYQTIPLKRLSFKLTRGRDRHFAEPVGGHGLQDEI